MWWSLYVKSGNIVPTKSVNHQHKVIIINIVWTYLCSPFYPHVIWFTWQLLLFLIFVIKTINIHTCKFFGIVPVLCTEMKWNFNLIYFPPKLHSRMSHPEYALHLNHVYKNTWSEKYILENIIYVVACFVQLVFIQY